MQTRGLDSYLDVAHIKGNVSDDTKRLVAQPMQTFMATDPSGNVIGFAPTVVERLEIIEVSVHPKRDEPRKKEAYVVIELDALEDTLNGGANVHGGCHAFLIDVCSSLALAAYSLEAQGMFSTTVSQSLNVVYHAPAPGGVRLRIVNTTMAVGARTASVRTEIWDITHKRLVSSGVHVKMNPSAPASSSQSKL
jgi:acyl-coenzyme A thioesterase 13